MAALTKMDYSIGYAEFSIDSAEEIALLPTTTTAGTGVLANVDKVKAGSAAYTTDGNLDVYILDGSDVWNKVE